MTGVVAALILAIRLAIAHSLLAGGTDKLVIRALIGFSCMCAVLPFAFFIQLPAGELWAWLLASGALHPFETATRSHASESMYH